MPIYQKQGIQMYLGYLPCKKRQLITIHWIHAFTMEFSTSPQHLGRIRKSTLFLMKRSRLIKKPDTNWVYGSHFSQHFLNNKTKTAAWVVSNCIIQPSNRNELVRALVQHGIQVDVYGHCGNNTCGKESNCFEKLGKEYKFYMALENSLCVDYITEKITHGLFHNMVPIVWGLGSNLDNYAPPGSYIDALEFTNISDLATRIKFLDENPKEYFKYFEWRQMYNLSSINDPHYRCYGWKKIKQVTERFLLANKTHAYDNLYQCSSTEQTALKEKRPFIILFWTDTWHAVDVEEFFESLHGCGEEFKITSDRTNYDQADVVIFDYHELNEGLRNGTAKMPAYRNPDAPWILATQESPIRTKPLETNIYDGSFNLTWGYRNNADINIKFEEMYEKYEKPEANWIYGSEFSFQFLKTKTKLAAWVVSNCNVTASKRDVFVKELAKHGVTVDIFGKCGQPFKGRGIDGNWRESDCFEELGNQYKFYMSMENSLCLDYITEKSEHGWAHNMVPIIYAMGKKDQASPPRSYVDALEFGRTEDLAEYIKFLDSNPREYFKFFEWRSMYNISSSFHSRAHCYAWEKMRDLTEKLRLADDDVRNKLHHLGFVPKMARIGKQVDSIMKPEWEKPFIILFWTTWYGGDAAGFDKPECHNEIRIISNKSQYESANVVVFQYVDLVSTKIELPKTRKPHMPWILSLQEAPINYPLLNPQVYNGVFNFTASFRKDSEIHTLYNESLTTYSTPDLNWEYGSDYSNFFLQNKTKLVAWVVSNCFVQFSKRNEFVKALNHHGIQVDIYGKCGNDTCGKGSECFAKLGEHYKFYLALENSLCVDYVTEKITHGLYNNMVPIIWALGEDFAPSGSYIDAMDFETVEDLAKHIQFLNKYDEEYFKHFEWRKWYNLSSINEPGYSCYGWRKIKSFTERFLKEKRTHVYDDLEKWYLHFWNDKTNTLCSNCLDAVEVDVKNLRQNKLTVYNGTNYRCFK
ncbi:Alpha-(1,3)-fucosyltransferase C [Orchesella cincta]|uniref:Fucosyltransferase n=1 Tax=Orchesella cincta TaxID=48709 RepID=A0A1D2M2P5_ORCCI|nr:Alpha-(1,3)-fucosyltransferase C [Orchesella cincta]